MLSLVEAIKICWQKSFDFGGRARRSEFWWFYLFTELVLFAAGHVANFVEILFASISFKNFFFEGVPYALTLLAFALVILPPLFAVLVRRLHDLDFSGWWCIPFLFVFFITDDDFAAFEVALLIPPFVLLLVLAFKGTKGVNRFGDDPLAANFR